jgi:8-oxo-dGTP pyrophosphatase MutT (NUDIX family)
MHRIRQAAVAVVLAAGEAGDEILVIRRATAADDPWSGHIALPGGRSEPQDPSLEATARRETLEETGIDLAGSDCVAALSPVTPLSMPVPSVSVAPFVFRYHGDKSVRLSREVVEAWWLPVAEIRAPDAWQATGVALRDGSVIDVRGFQMRGHVLWGLTARILEEFLELPAL